MPRQSREKSGTGIYQMIIRTVPLIAKTASKAVREVRRKLASRGERLSSEKARAIAGKTRANNLIKREVNSIITEETNSASSKVVSSIVKGRRIKNE